MRCNVLFLCTIVGGQFPVMIQTTTHWAIYMPGKAQGITAARRDEGDSWWRGKETLRILHSDLWFIPQRQESAWWRCDPKMHGESPHCCNNIM